MKQKTMFPFTFIAYSVVLFLSVISPSQQDIRHVFDFVPERYPQIVCLKNGEKLTSIEQKCCEGYSLAPDLRCNPACDPPCVNGQCTAPNYCECHTNFTQDLSGSCVPACPVGCLNGACLTNGTITCNPGYRLSENEKFCQPICSKTCPAFMNCTAPDRCSCRQGYYLNREGFCRPKCQMNCLGGECASPNICFCYPDFAIKDGVCQAECQKRNCKNGKCILKDVCICDPGYTRNTTTGECDPVCNECNNGICIAPGICKCDDGYVPDGGTCKPFCFNNCENGFCLAPYQCACKDGFGKNPTGFCMPLDCRTGFTEKSCIIYHIGKLE